MINKKEGQLRKIFPVIVLILLLAIVIIAAESINEEISTIQEIQITEVPSETSPEIPSETQTIEIQENIKAVEDNSEIKNSEINIETPATEIESNPPEIINRRENINCDASNLICADGFNLTCETFCDSKTKVCTSYNLGCEGHEQIMEDEIKDEIKEQNETIENETEERNEITQFEQNKTIPPLNGEVIETELPQIDVQLIYLEKITRGEEIELRVIITNMGNQTATNILAELHLPPEFEIISGSKIENCGNLGNGEICTVVVTAQTSSFSSLGVNEINVTVSYKNGI